MCVHYSVVTPYHWKSRNMVLQLNLSWTIKMQA